MFNLYRLPAVNQSVAKGVNFNRSPIGCSGPILPLRESAGNPEVNNSVLDADYDTLRDGAKLELNVGAPFLSSKSCMCSTNSVQPSGVKGVTTYKFPNGTQTHFSKRSASGVTVGDIDFNDGLVVYGSSATTVDYPGAPPNHPHWD